MATSANPNNFNLSGFVAVSATIKSFDNSSVARFPLSVSRKEPLTRRPQGSQTRGEETTRKSALINCECWAKTTDSTRFALLEKGKLVSISGYIRPDEYTDRNGEKQQRVVFVVTSVSEPSTASATTAEKKPAKGKAKKAVEAAA